MFHRASDGLINNLTLLFSLMEGKADVLWISHVVYVLGGSP